MLVGIQLQETLMFSASVIFIWIAITVLIDVFRRDDLSGWGNAAWTIFTVILPWIGVLVYLIAEHDGMAKRRAKDVATSQAQFDDAVPRAAGTGGAAAEIEKQLLERRDPPSRVRRHPSEGTCMTRVGLSPTARN